jgi:hypothetical protein
MRSTTRLRRVFAASACGGLASALVWLPAGPAAASVTNTLEASANASSQFTGTAATTCDLTSGEDAVTSTQAQFSDGDHARSVSLDATFTNSADPGDVTRATGHFKGSLDISKRNGDLTSFRLNGSGSADVVAAEGDASQCATDASLGVEGATAFSEGNPGWLYVTRKTGPSAEAAIFAFNRRTKETLLFEQFVGGASRSTSRTFLTADRYSMPELFLGLDTTSPADAKIRASQGVSVAARMTGTFFRTGAAFGPTHGAGGTFVRFPGSVSCSRHSARLTFTSAAGRLAGAAFSVNGHQVASVDNPKPGRHVMLRHLSKTADITITTRLTLAGGAHTSAKRTYVPCAG